MTPTERKLAAALLDLAADEFSNHGCNDFSLRRDAKLTDTEAREIVALYNEHDGRVNPVGFEPAPESADCMHDSMLMRYVAAKLRSQG